VWKPAVFAIAVMVLLFVTGINMIFVLIGFGVVAFTLATTLDEYWRGTRARRKLSGENYFAAFTHLIARNRRRYGGYMIHLGVLVMGIGVIGSINYQTQTQRSLIPGGTMTVGDYTITYERALTCDPSSGQMSSDCDAWYTDRGRDIMVVAGYMTVAHGNEPPVRVAPYREIFLNGTGELTPPGVLSSVGEDLYLLFLGEQSGFGTIKAYINPLIQFLWIGGIILIIGTLVAMWPTSTERRQTAAVPERVGGMKAVK
jgi:cytochrome c-type biogenesis protein CcmF